MFTEPSIRRAIQHLTANGDTDIFPRLPELKFFSDQEDEVTQAILRMNAGQYQPVSSVEVLTPKSRLGFRIGHQLCATDILFYTAATIEAAQGVEDIRVRASGDVAFSYRYDPAGEEGRLFLRERSYHDWLRSLTNFGGETLFGGNPEIVETDISDFYSRIYFHRVENLLNDADAPCASKDAIKRIIQTCRARQSFGLPVGSSASRLLAEGVLADTDQMLTRLGVTTTRYVDDFKIIANGRQNAHSVLCRLAEYLMVTEGLSLNPSKTKITDLAQMHASSSGRLDDVFSPAEMTAMQVFLRQSYGGEEEEDGDDVAALNPFLTGAQLLDRLDELSRRDGDLPSQKVILRMLRHVAIFDPLRLLNDHATLAYYLPRDFSLAIASACRFGVFLDKSAVAERIFHLLSTPPICELAFARLWLLNLFVCGALPPDQRVVDGYPTARPNALEERQLVFVRALLGDRAYFRERRGQLGQVGEWIKPALLIGARCLPADEYLAWLDVAIPQTADPLARAFKAWLRDRRELPAILE